ncbi:hypothetical protein LX32DRAFT_79248 [Colletotrichum zoysiae]|uniref:Uncharacterized protein n=1 Tax=Colletotrichum zoysiae TaxID=1216348 RepID=A0AAD9H9W6_9PEZI|nr:hypothetical protein LX32DRAFT_79248 [Colletotrichum zoysiae]
MRWPWPIQGTLSLAPNVSHFHPPASVCFVCVYVCVSRDMSLASQSLIFCLSSSSSSSSSPPLQRPTINGRKRHPPVARPVSWCEAERLLLQIYN